MVCFILGNQVYLGYSGVGRGAWKGGWQWQWWNVNVGRFCCCQTIWTKCMPIPIEMLDYGVCPVLSILYLCSPFAVLIRWSRLVMYLAMFVPCSVLYIARPLANQTPALTALDHSCSCFLFTVTDSENRWCCKIILLEDKGATTNPTTNQHDQQL